jgi:hypothetical protein
MGRDNGQEIILDATDYGFSTERYMSEFVVDENLRNQLMNLNRATKFCGKDGQVIGVFIPQIVLEPLISEEELDRREQEEEEYSTGEVLEYLRKL